jgi:hypothetical protein
MVPGDIAMVTTRESPLEGSMSQEPPFETQACDSDGVTTLPNVRPGKPPLVFGRRLMLWTAICAVSAAPSFVLAMMAEPGRFDLAGMITGILTAIAIYTWATGTPFVASLQASRRAARALRIGYLVRMFLSALFPLGMIIDFWSGVLSGSLVDVVAGGTITRSIQSGARVGFGITLSVTLLQGVVLNLFGFMFMWIVYLLLPRRLDTETIGLCEKCGYDLRASYEYGRCPECGTPCVPPPGWTGEDPGSAGDSTAEQPE